MYVVNLRCKSYQGLYSSIFAIFMVIGSIELMQNVFEMGLTKTNTDLKIIGLIFIFIFIAGLLLSWLATFFAVRKFINQNETKLYN